MQDDKRHLFDEYIVQGESSRKQRAENWQIAIGLQDVDRLQNSPYLLETAKEHIERTVDLATVQKRIAEYYKTEEGRKLAATRSDEADTVAMRIQAILAEDAHRIDSPNWGGGGSISIKRFSSSFRSPARRLRKKRSKNLRSGSMPFCTLR